MKDSDVAGMARTMMRSARIGGGYEPSDHADIIAAMTEGSAVQPDLVAMSKGVPVLVVCRNRTSRQAAYDRYHPDILKGDARSVSQYAENAVAVMLPRLLSLGKHRATVGIAMSADSSERYMIRPFLMLRGWDTPRRLRFIPDLSPVSPWRITGYIESVVEEGPAVQPEAVARRLSKTISQGGFREPVSVASAILVAMTSDRFCTTMMDGSDDAAYIAEAAVDLLSRDPPTFRDPYSSKSYMPYLVSVMRSASQSGKSKGEHSLLREFSEEVESSGIPTSGYGALVDAMVAPPKKGALDGSSMASLLVELVDPKPGEVFLDPFCGYGLTLTAAWDRMGQGSQSPVGYTSDLYDQACSSMILHGRRSVPVMKGSPWDLQWAKGGKRPDAVACDLCGKDTSGRPVLEALDAVLDSAGTGARVAVAVPREPVVSDDTSDAEARDRILSGNTLRGVVSVGRDRMVLLFVARKANSSDTIFYSLPAGGNDLDKMISRVRDGKRGVAGASTRAKVRDSVWWPLGKKA